MSNNNRFRVIGLKVLSGCSQHIRKNLKTNVPYFFYNDYEEGDNDYSLKKKEAAQMVCQDLYDINGYNGKKITVDISAIVGKNGDGKSSLIEVMIRIINNFAVSCGFTIDQETLLFIKDLRAILYYELNGHLMAIVCKDRTIQLYKDGEKVFQGGAGSKTKQWKQSGWEHDIFYTEIINYSLYAYNSLSLKQEGSNGIESWIDALFHKNDSYQTPIVLNPMRTEGNIDINREEYLSRQRLMTIFTESNSSEQRKISATKEAVSYRFRLDDNVKLLTKTIGDYFRSHLDDYHEWELMDEATGDDDLLTKDRVQMALNKFASFWKGFGDELNQNGYFVRMIGECLPQMAARGRNSDLRRYLRKIDKLTQTSYGYYGHENPRIYYRRFYNNEYKAFNYTHLNRLAYIFVVWHNLQRKELIPQGISIDEALVKRKEPKYANVLYLLYKTISVIDTYAPYNTRGLFPNAQFSLFDKDWDDWLHDKKVRNVIDEVMEEDSYRTLKLHQTINYLRGPMTPFDSKKSDGYYNIEFVQLQKRINEAREVIPGGKQIPTIKLLLPPVFVGDIMIEQDGQSYSMSELSSGERQRLNTVGSLVYHLRNLDTAMPHQDQLTYTDVNVVLEEVELYFHPEYQKGYVKFLLEQIAHIGLQHIKGINMCFVTHSPFVLSDIPHGNILYLQDGEPEKKEKKLNTFGANIGDLIRTSFFLTEGAMGDFARSFIDKIVVALELHDELNKKSQSNESIFEIDYENKPYYSFLMKDDGSLNRRLLNTKYSMGNLQLMIEMIDEPLVRSVLQEEWDDVNNARTEESE